MTIRSRSVIVAATATFGWMAGPPAVSGAATPLACGALLTSNTTLTGDLTNCPGDGLVIAADNITVDLNGHTVGGDRVRQADRLDAGIRMQGHRGVTIRGGSVRRFWFGVLLDASDGNLVTGLTVDDNEGQGVLLLNGADANRVADSVLTGNEAGLVLADASRNTIAGNALSDREAGMRVVGGSEGNFITGNRFEADGPQAVEVLFANGNTITHNRISDTGSGIILESSDSTTIADNEIRHSVASACDGCGIGIQIYGNDNLVARNRIVDAPRYGIEVDDFQDPGHTPATGAVLRDNLINDSGEGIAIGPEAGGVVLHTRIEHNVVTGALDDGIQLTGPSTGLETSVLTRNVAVHNGDLGIEAVAGVVDGGGNHAAANGNPLECTNVVCRW